MQIRSIVLYHRDGVRSHEVEFHVGELNVVTGVSDTGKSALIEIVDYCLGSDRHGVYRGDELDTIGWYGLRLRIGNQPLFVARRAPHPEQKSSDNAVVLVGIDDAPEPGTLRPTTNAKALTVHLGSLLGIHDVRDEIPDDGSRARVTAGLRHALAYVFQRQKLIADPEYLFAGQDRPFAAVAIRDTLPYFLGAVDKDALQQRRELQARRRELHQLRRQLAASTDASTSLARRVGALIQEARDVGLAGVAPDADDTAGAHALLREIRDRPVGATAGELVGGAGRLATLHDRRKELADDLQAVRASRRVLVDRERLTADYSREATEQRARLLSLALLPEKGADDADDRCPVCGEHMQQPDPDAAQLREALVRANEQSRVSAVAEPRLQAEIEAHDARAASLRGSIAEVDRELAEVTARSALARQAQSLAEVQAYVRGRVAVFMEQHPVSIAADIAALQTEVGRAEALVHRLEEHLSADATRRRTQSKLEDVGHDMTALAQRLDLRFSEHGVRLDPVALTVVADAPGRPALLNEDIGSGKNWVGYHLVTLLALHRYFIDNGRPVPRLLMLDQPTQAFFPSEIRNNKTRSIDQLRDEDQVFVHKIFELLKARVEELEGQLQIIVMDHAEFPDPWFERAAPNNWRDGRGLVPNDWVDRV